MTVPDGVRAGDEFLLEYEGTQLSVICPQGCRSGDSINLQVDLPETSESSSVVVVIPDGCYAGDTFTVEHGGASFDVIVPDGCGPGMELTVEAPAPAGMVVTKEMYDEAFKKASRMGTKPDEDMLRWCLNTYCEHNGDIASIFAAMGDNPAEALKKPTYCDTPEVRGRRPNSWHYIRAAVPPFGEAHCVSPRPHDARRNSPLITCSAISRFAPSDPQPSMQCTAH